MRRWALAMMVWMVVAMAVAPTAVASEDEEAPMTEEQVELNERGVEALIEGRSARAVALLEEAMRLGELNVLALNLGRAYHGLGRCEEARELLESVPELPAVDGVPAERINERAMEYLEEVDEACEEDEETEVEAPELEDEESLAQPSPEPEPVDPPSTALGWGAVAGGGALVASGVGLHLLARDRRAQVTDHEGSVNREVRQSEVADIESRANTYDTLGLSALIAGAALGGFGGYWLYRTRESSETTVDVGVSSGFRGVTVRGRF